ncbi:MAG: hypothetical protein DWQ36_04650 [Acidobacteria bacterium]|nr:MAG: hypothetical protein DWQ30_16170 [Acidobacteriota bacterium]REK10328.1 MAG: hypothetical protein DWQ36_04650 [Acidobacteriota bacterium]
MKQVDLIVAALGVASVVVVLLGDLGFELAGTAPLALHRYYVVAAAAGWLFGNLYVARRRSGTRPRSVLLMVYGLAPIPPLFLLRAMARREALDAAPLVPLFACGVYLALFVVPVSMAAPGRQQVRLQGRGRTGGTAADRSSAQTAAGASTSPHRDAAEHSSKGSVDESTRRACERDEDG